MKAINTHDLTPESVAQLSDEVKYWIYNALDCCLTAEILSVIKPQLDDVTRATYEFSKSLQAPTLEMRMRGIRVDEQWRQRTIGSYTDDLRTIESNLNRILEEGIGVKINWNSPLQLKKLFGRRRGKISDFWTNCTIPNLPNSTRPTIIIAIRRICSRFIPATRSA